MVALVALVVMVGPVVAVNSLLLVVVALVTVAVDGSRSGKRGGKGKDMPNTTDNFNEGGDGGDAIESGDRDNSGDIDTRSSPRQRNPNSNEEESDSSEYIGNSLGEGSIKMRIMRRTSDGNGMGRRTDPKKRLFREGNSRGVGLVRGLGFLRGRGDRNRRLGDRSREIGRNKNENVDRDGNLLSRAGLHNRSKNNFIPRGDTGRTSARRNSVRLRRRRLGRERNDGRRKISGNGQTGVRKRRKRKESEDLESFGFDNLETLFKSLNKSASIIIGSKRGPDGDNVLKSLQRGGRTRRGRGGIARTPSLLKCVGMHLASRCVPVNMEGKEAQRQFLGCLEMSANACDGEIMNPEGIDVDALKEKELERMRSSLSVRKKN